MKKTLTVAFLAISMIISVASAAYVIHYQYVVTNRMRLVVDNQFILWARGSPGGDDYLTEIDWGDFYNGEMKYVDATLYYQGPSPGYVGWDIPVEDKAEWDVGCWVVNIWIYDDTWTNPVEQWLSGFAQPQGPFVAGDYLRLRIQLYENIATPGLQYENAELTFFGLAQV